MGGWGGNAPLQPTRSCARVHQGPWGTARNSKSRASLHEKGGPAGRPAGASAPGCSHCAVYAEPPPSLAHTLVSTQRQPGPGPGRPIRTSAEICPVNCNRCGRRGGGARAARSQSWLQEGPGRPGPTPSCRGRWARGRHWARGRRRGCRPSAWKRRPEPISPACLHDRWHGAREIATTLLRMLHRTLAKQAHCRSLSLWKKGME